MAHNLPPEIVVTELPKLIKRQAHYRESIALCDLVLGPGSDGTPEQKQQAQEMRAELLARLSAVQIAVQQKITELQTTPSMPTATPPPPPLDDTRPTLEPLMPVTSEIPTVATEHESEEVALYMQEIIANLKLAAPYLDYSDDEWDALEKHEKAKFISDYRPGPRSVLEGLIAECRASADPLVLEAGRSLEYKKRKMEERILAPETTLPAKPVPEAPKPAPQLVTGDNTELLALLRLALEKLPQGHQAPGAVTGQPDSEFVDDHEPKSTASGKPKTTPKPTPKKKSPDVVPPDSILSHFDLKAIDPHKDSAIKDPSVVTKAYPRMEVLEKLKGAMAEIFEAFKGITLLRDIPFWGDANPLVDFLSSTAFAPDKINENMPELELLTANALVLAEAIRGKSIVVDSTGTYVSYPPKGFVICYIPSNGGIDVIMQNGAEPRRVLRSIA